MSDLSQIQAPGAGRSVPCSQSESFSTLPRKVFSSKVAGAFLCRPNSSIIPSFFFFRFLFAETYFYGSRTSDAWKNNVGPNLLWPEMDLCPHWDCLLG